MLYLIYMYIYLLTHLTQKREKVYLVTSRMNIK